MGTTNLTLNALIAIWLLITGLGVMQARQLLMRAKDARSWLVNTRLNGIRLYAADAAIRLAKARIFVQLCLFTMGLVVIATQFYPQGTPMRSVLSGMFRLLMITAAATLTFKSYMEVHELDRVLDETDRASIYESAATLSTEQIRATDANTEEVRANTLATDANTKAREETS